MDKGADSRGTYRAVYTNIWDDPDFRKLTTNERLILLNLRTSPLTNMPVIYPYYIDAIEKQTGIDRKCIQKAIDTLWHRDWIAIEDGIVWVKKGLKYDPNISLSNPKHKEAIKKVILSLPKVKLVSEFIKFYNLDIPYSIDNNIPYANQEPEPEPDKEKDPDIHFPKPQELLTLFSTLCPNLSQITELPKSRKEKIEVRLKEHSSLSWWEIVFQKANLISFSGKDGEIWKPTFDWLVKNDKNAVKVYEGNYDKNKQQKHAGLKAWANEIMEEEDGRKR